MLSHLSMWVLAAALGHVPASTDAAWLKAIPADVDVAVHFRGLEAARNDLETMLKAMSPRLAEQVMPNVTTQLDQFKQRAGEPAVKTPWVLLLNIKAPGAEGGMPYAVVVLEGSYADVLASTNHGNAPKLTPQEGGFDAFDAPDGTGLWYAAKGTGFVAFGPVKELIAAIARPAGKSLDSVLTPALRKPFLGGDAGLYVNAGALATRYADQIDAGRQQFMAALDMAGQQAGNASTMEAAKTIYGGMFDAIKYADRLTLDLDFDAAGLDLAVALSAKPDTEAAKSIASASTGSAVALDKLPGDAVFYAYMNMDATFYDRMQTMALQLVNPAGKPSAEQQKAAARMHGLGRIESTGSTTISGGMRAFSVINVSDPKAFIEATVAMLQSMKGSEGELNVYKDVKVERDVQTYQGLTFSHLVATLDAEKMAKLAGNQPGSAASLKAMYGGDALHYWLGTDGKRLFHVMAPKWDDVKAQLDTYLKPGAGVGTQPGFKAVRSKLPEKASFLMLLNVQGLARVFATQFAAQFNKPGLKVPADMPAEPAFVGLSLTPVAPATYELHLVVPSPVGPVIEKGMVPLFQGLQGGNN
jgi:hypothetical protein